MTRLLASITTVFALILVAACVDHDHPKNPQTNRWGGSPTPTVSPTPEVSPTPVEPTPPLHVDVQNPNSTPGQAPIAKGELKYGIPVPGSPGFVNTPFQPSRMIDVRGFAPGTEVKDPDTNQIFLVPDMPK